MRVVHVFVHTSIKNLCVFATFLSIKNGRFKKIWNRLDRSYWDFSGY